MAEDTDSYDVSLLPITEQGLAPSSATTAGARRRPKACDSCWQRKIRCDEQSGRCRNCQKYGQKCTMTRADGSLLVRGGDEHIRPPRNSRNVPRKRHSYQESPDSGLELRRMAQTLTASPSHERDLPQNFNNEPLQQLLSRNTAQVTNGSPNTDPSPGMQSLTSRDSMTATGVEGVVLIETNDDPQKCKYVGKTSTQVLAKSAEEYFRPEGFYLGVMEFFCPLLSHSEEVPMTVRSKHQPLIDKDTAIQCINAFFDSIHRIFPFLDELQTRRVVDEFYDHGNLHEPASICCIYLLIAIGARSLPASEHVSATHFAATWAMYDVILASPYLTSVQCLILMTIELTNQNKEGQAIFAIGTAIRIAQSLGLHRALSAHKEMIELRFVEKNHHLRSCIWWTCYSLDKKLSFEAGRLSIINDTDCDVERITGPALLGSGNDKNETTSEPAVFPYMIQLCQILSTIMSRLYSRIAESNDEHSLLMQIATIDKMLTDWRSTLPQTWRTDPDLMGADMSARSMDSVLLYCIYYNALLVIHRAALFGKLPTSVKDFHSVRIASSNVVCLNASRSLAKYVNVLVNSPASWPFLRWTTPYCLNIIFTLYVGVMKDPSHWMADADMGLMRSIMRCFSSSCSHQVAITPFENLLQTLGEAMQTARTRKRLNMSVALPNTSRQTDLETRENAESSGLQQINGASNLDALLSQSSQGPNFDTDFQFQDFFDFGVGGEGTSVFQMWPLGPTD